MSSIYREPAVVRRISQRSSLKKITSNSTIAAAVMVLAALIALVVANSPAHEVVREILEVQMSFSLGMIHAHMALETFVNDFLMAIFFLLVGIELKYEVTVGQLRKPRQAMLPMLAAVGGVAVPALIYLALNASTAPHGWATPPILRLRWVSCRCWATELVRKLRCFSKHLQLLMISWLLWSLRFSMVTRQILPG